MAGAAVGSALGGVSSLIARPSASDNLLASPPANACSSVLSHFAHVLNERVGVGLPLVLNLGDRREQIPSCRPQAIQYRLGRLEALAHRRAVRFEFGVSDGIHEGGRFFVVAARPAAS